MVVWILFAPGSWLIGRSKLHDDYLTHLGDSNSVVPPETLTKYAGHTAVHLTHTLPGALWAGLIPFQLHPTFRSRWPRLHRLFGYTFFASAFLMSGGIVIIFKRDLFFEKFFPDLPPPKYSSELYLFGLAVYFASTAIYALKCAIARRFASHQRWVIRHVSSGMWVILQRFFLMTIYQAIYRPPVPREVQRRVFAEAAIIANVFSIFMGEYALYLLDQQKAKKID
jgi:hypothetical protein